MNLTRYIKYVLPLVLSMIYLIPGGFAQTKKAFIRSADEAYDKKDFNSALAYYEEALAFDSTQLEVAYMAAEAARQFNAYTRAKIWYEKVLELDKNNQYPDAQFYLGEMYQKLGLFDQAIQSYNFYIAESSQPNDWKTEKANKEVMASEWAKQVINRERKDVEIERLGDQINSPYTEFGATPMGDTLLFSSLRFEHVVNKNQPPVLYSQIMGSSAMGQAERESLLSDSMQITAHTAFNQKGDRLYFTICEYVNASDLRCDLYYRDKKDGVWGPAVKLPDYINQDSITSTQPNVGYDENMQKEVLYFVSDRPGGKGKLDIWSTSVNADGTFNQPINVAAANTNEDDITPFYHIPTNTLYFSSTGQKGLGGFDVYKIAKYSQGWGKINHMGNVINTSYNDVYFSMKDDGKEGYLSSNRLGAQYVESTQEACCYDIYKLKFNTSDIRLLASTFDRISREALLGATVTLHNLTDPESDPIMITNLDSNLFVFPLESGKEYKVVAEKDGFDPDSLFFNTLDVFESLDIKKNLFLKSQTIDLDLLTFDKTTLEPLPGTTVTLVDLSDTLQAPLTLTNEDGNDYHFPLLRGKKYLVLVSKKGYAPESLEIDTRDYDDVNTINKKVYLGLGDLESFLPLIVFFDNDLPDPKSWKSSTDTRYGDMFPPYLTQESNYINMFTEGLAGASISQGTTELQRFFENRVKKGGEDLSKFLEILQLNLEHGAELEISIKGYASPRSSADYNYRLGQRRVQNVLNEIEEFENGVLKPYIQSGQLKIQQKSFGETAVPRGVSDKIDDPRNSIYSVPASQERRVEIVQIKRTK